jgi:fatty acid CoA ligase FadD36
MLLTALTGSADDRGDAVRVAGRAMSRESLLSCATAVADRLTGCHRVAIEATPTLHTVVGVTAALLAGATVVPIPPDAGRREREHILRDSGAGTALAPVGTSVEGAAVPAVPIDLDGRSSATHREPDPGHAAMILYTSGTTGAPKGAVIPRRAVAACLDGLAEAWDWTRDDVLVHGLPLFHVHGLILGVLGPLRIGCRLEHVGRPRPERYAAAGGSLYFGVPTIWSRIAADPGSAASLSRARLLVSGSAPLPAPVFERIAALSSHRVVERYGMTETLITVSARADRPRVRGTVGTPLPGVETRLVDEGGGPLADDGSTMGELLVRGPTLFRGYLGPPDADAASVMADGWFRTGDIATIAPDGRHRIVGRASTDLIKSGGYRIGAGEVEDALLAHPGVHEAAVVGTSHPDLGEQVTAYVVADGVTPADLVDFVAGTLSAHKRPRSVHIVDRLPRNAMGKVNKALLG